MIPVLIRQVFSCSKKLDYISQETLASSLVFAENDGKETEAGDEKASIKVVKA